ncbi:MAG: SpoIIE family protein phosphatase [Planctomycetes bacterium]|nr:SpoIIE family protein phosphatase [Planctomycetota bacterium]
MAKLVQIEGPHRGKEYTLGKAVVLGRRLDADVRIPDSTVSRRHAKITETSKGFMIEDLKSGNGTIVNGQIISRTTPLKHSDKVRIGKALFIFSSNEQAELQTLDEPSVSFVDSSPTNERTILGTIEPEKHSIATTTIQTVARARTGAAQARLKMVLRISESMQSELDLGQLLPKMMDGLFQIFPSADRGLIMLLDRNSGELVPRVTKAKGGIEDEKQMMVSKTVVNEVRKSRMSILSADAMTDQRFEAGASIAALHIRSVMCVPLIRQDDLLGLIYIDTSSRAAKFTSDDLDLLTGIAAQAALAIQNARMHDSLLKRQRLEQDMQFAQEVQKSFLPERVPEVSGFEFDAWYGSALDVGGDFYDFIDLPDDKLSIVIGDVSGKGLPAALMMAKLMSDVRFFALSEREPGKVLSKLNDHIAHSRAAEDRFVTLLYIMLDPNSRTVWLANAGHPFPIMRKHAGEVRPLDQSVNLPLGVVENTEYTQQVCSMDPGDTIAIFTDGVTEAMNAAKSQFGGERLQKAVERASPSAKSVKEQILADINEFVGLASPSDDLTLVCFGPKP